MVVDGDGDVNLGDPVAIAVNDHVNDHVNAHADVNDGKSRMILMA